MSMEKVNKILEITVYAIQAGQALWGLFFITMVWTRVARKRFPTEQAQDAFLDSVEEPLGKGDFDGVVSLCDGNQRALPQLILLSVLNRNLGFRKARHIVEDRFQRDILADLEHRMTWVHTVIKTAPMMGLFGTVTGMMGAFGQLAVAENVKPADLASNISLALITTVIGLAIAIPLMVAVSAVNIRIRKMEELVTVGLNRYLEYYQAVLGSLSKKK